ncbi:MULTISPECIES: hypothetical protein [Rhizobium]|uniref:hypothetical protein n=1 Tax=Rhizobium TaxID=379 RepID=UPI0019563973|nr:MULTISPECIES: hypothetical protein [Rhizobium]MBM7046993.1 hypothetical protein [Rhizobium lusitanum]
MSVVILIFLTYRAQALSFRDGLRQSNQGRPYRRQYSIPTPGPLESDHPAQARQKSRPYRDCHRMAGCFIPNLTDEHDKYPDIFAAWLADDTIG